MSSPSSMGWGSKPWEESDTYFQSIETWNTSWIYESLGDKFEQ